MANKFQRVAIYLRVSTDEQTDSINPLAMRASPMTKEPASSAKLHLESA